MWRDSLFGLGQVSAVVGGHGDEEKWTGVRKPIDWLEIVQAYNIAMGHSN